MLNFIVNPAHLRGKVKNIIQTIETRLTELGREFKIHKTKEKGDAGRFAAQISAEGESTIIAVGGDGMMNDVLSGIVHPENTIFGLIPAGTGNDFSAAANIPYGEKALDLIVNGDPKYTDYIQFDDGKRTMNIAGIGIDVDILIRCEKMKLVRGKGKYFLSLLSSLMKYRGSKITVEVDGEKREINAMISAVCNGKQLGGGIPLCPIANVGDGKMELIYVEYPKRSKLLGALIQLMKGKLLELPFAHHVLCERAVITPESRCMAQYDGELYEADSLAATLVSGKLKMFRG